MILGEAVKTTLFVRNLLVEMGFPQHIGGPTPMQGDNWPATTLIPEQRLTERNRFFVTDFHFANEAYELQEIIPVWVDTINNGADIYTKAVPNQIMQRLRPRETGYSDYVLPPINYENQPKPNPKL